MSTQTVTLTGIQPTGEVHLGNYAGAIQPLLRLAADDRRDVYVFVADLHALNGQPGSRRAGRAVAPRGGRPAGVRPRAPQRAPLPPEPRAGDRAPGDAAERRHVQGAAQPRARLQGGGRRQRRGGPRPRPRRQRRPLLLPGADGGRHPRPRAPTRCRSAPTRPSTWRSPSISPSSSRAPTGPACCASRARSSTTAVATLPGLDGRKMSKSYGNTIALMARRRRRQAQADPADRHRLHATRAAQGPGRVHAGHAAARLRRRGHGRRRSRRAIATAASATARSRRCSPTSSSTTSPRSAIATSSCSPMARRSGNDSPPTNAMPRGVPTRSSPQP